MEYIKYRILEFTIAIGILLLGLLITHLIRKNRLRKSKEQDIKNEANKKVCDHRNEFFIMESGRRYCPDCKKYLS